MDCARPWRRPLTGNAALDSNDERKPRLAARGGTKARPGGLGCCHRGHGLDKRANYSGPCSGRWLTKKLQEKQTKVPRLCLVAREFAVHGPPLANEVSFHANSAPHNFLLSHHHPSPQSPSLSSSLVWALESEGGMRCQPQNEKDTINIPCSHHPTYLSTVRHKQLLQFWSSGPTATTATATISKTLRRQSP